MAVIIKTGWTLTKLTKNLWPNKTVYGSIYVSTKAEELETAGYQLSVTPSVLRIIVDTGKEYAVIAKSNLKADVLKLVMQNKAGFLAKNTIKDQVVDMIVEAHAKFLDGDGPVPKPKETETSVIEAHLNQYKDEVMSMYAANGTNKVAAIKKLREKMHCSLKFAKDTVETWIDEETEILGSVAAGNKESSIAGIENPTYANINLPIMDLAKAEHLHQPVKGTSGGSRYYVVALGDNAKVAVRIKNAHDISIRALSTAMAGSTESEEVLEGFAQANLQKATSGKHWSLHLQPTDMTMAVRSIGSTLFAMDISFWAVSGHLKGLVGK